MAFRQRKKTGFVKNQVLIVFEDFRLLFHIPLKHLFIYYGYERNTTDMDIWLKPESSNRDKLINALNSFEDAPEYSLDLIHPDIIKI